MIKFGAIFAILVNCYYAAFTENEINWLKKNICKGRERGAPGYQELIGNGKDIGKGTFGVFSWSDQRTASGP